MIINTRTVLVEQNIEYRIHRVSKQDVIIIKT